MLKSFLTASFRYAIRYKGFAAINAAGLALGIACTLLIALCVRQELRYDRDWTAADRIVRISEDVASVNGNPGFHFAGAAPALAPLLPGYFSEVRRAARLSACVDQMGGLVLRTDRHVFQERTAVAVDPEIFDIFDFRWLQGSAASALRNPRGLVLTQRAVQRYFGGPNAMGKTLSIDGIDGLFVVEGVIADLPQTTHLRFDLLLSLAYLPPDSLQSWGGACYHTYALLAPGASVRSIEQRAPDFYDDLFRAGSSRYRGFTVVPIARIHLHSTREGELKPPGSATNVYALGAIAALVLLVAGINFVNLATARASHRAAEIGIRKSVGASRLELAMQFAYESTMLVVVATGLATALVTVLLKAFGSFVGMNLTIADLGSPEIIAIIVLTVPTVGLLAGAYPAFALSRLRPVQALRGEGVNGGSEILARKALVVTQLAISIALVAATLVIFEQAKFGRTFEPGYDKEQIVIVSRIGKGFGATWASLKQQWQSLAEVRAATASFVTPGTRSTLRSQVTVGTDDIGVIVTLMPIEFDFFETYGIEVLAGRSLSEGRGDRARPERPTETLPSPESVVLSKLTAQRLGWTPQEAVGRAIDHSGRNAVVVGVVDDVHLESVRDAITPVVYLVPQTASGIHEASIRVTGRNLDRTLAEIDAVWNRVVPDQPVRRRFLDEDFEALYSAEERDARVLALFAALAIVIGNFGLLGLVSFATARRTKEVGIRKVLGASVLQIVGVLAAEFATLALIANLVAWPLVYFVMQRWLLSFAYRIELDLSTFLASGVLALLLSTATVTLVAGRAALAKPVSALRHE